MFAWLGKNNKLNNLEFHFEWFRLLDSFEEEGISLFYIICEEFFSEYHNHSLAEEYYFDDTQVSLAIIGE